MYFREFRGSFSSDIKFFDVSSQLVKELPSEKKVPETLYPETHFSIIPFFSKKIKSGFSKPDFIYPAPLLRMITLIAKTVSLLLLSFYAKG
jgi:hypothetical protein